jgi:ATP-dependent DNA helicase RecG
MKQVIDLAKKIPDWVPTDILEKFDLPPLLDAITGIHFPSDDINLKQSTERLKFDELFLLQTKAALARMAKLSDKAPQLAFQQAQISDFVKSLPFTLTPSQKLSAWEILQDLARPTPMSRLLSGDVGSGKTVVAAMAMYSAVLNGYQAVLMAPTEILAWQHYESVVKMLGDKVSVALLTSSQFQISNFKFLNNVQFLNSKLTKREVIDFVGSGEIKIIIGTHALLSDKVEFAKLSLVIVDEQHRFGVEQRKAIKNKVNGGETPPCPPPSTGSGQALERGGVNGSPPFKEGVGGGLGDVVHPHFLSMTATPIPRSLALMIYGDLDLSTITELPPGRKKIITRLVEPHKRGAAYDFIRAQVKLGRQVFVVCPLIEQITNSKEQKTTVIPAKAGIQDKPDNDWIPAFAGMTNGGAGDNMNEKKSVMSEYEKLSQKIFTDLRVGYLHGKLKPAEKEAVMKKFKDGDIDVLVSTSVVEVGVDIPNASIMMIEGAERFGLAQLHQFRGRVGRSTHQSYCILFTQIDSPKSSERLKFFEAHHDGFKLAEKDLEMRGPGEVYGPSTLGGFAGQGVEQSGEMNLRLAKLTDKEIIKKAREAARLVAGDLKKYKMVLKKVREWGEKVHLE